MHKTNEDKKIWNDKRGIFLKLILWKIMKKKKK